MTSLINPGDSLGIVGNPAVAEAFRRHQQPGADIPLIELAEIQMGLGRVLNELVVVVDLGMETGEVVYQSTRFTSSDAALVDCTVEVDLGPGFTLHETGDPVGVPIGLFTIRFDLVDPAIVQATYVGGYFTHDIPDFYRCLTAAIASKE